LLLTAKSKRLKFFDRFFQFSTIFFVPIIAMLPTRQAGRIFARSQVWKTELASLPFKKIRPESGGNELQFLHIGKAGGNSIKFAFEKGLETNGHQATGGQKFIKTWGHKYKLGFFADDVEYIVNVRDPVSRFNSGFYSRKRMGKPKKDVPHTLFEHIAFRNFSHANELAEALSDSSVLRRMNAAIAMTTIGHVSQLLCSWFTVESLQKHPPFAVLELGTLEACMNDLARKLSVDGFQLPKDNFHSHANDYSETLPLSDRARANLELWYAEDYKVYRYLTGLNSHNNS
jgi:hypothetical protein